MNKIRKTKLVSKLMILIILMITIFTGFACTFAVAKEDKRATKLAFVADEYQQLWDVKEIWWEGMIQHQRAYKEADMFGSIDGISFTAVNKLYFHVKIDYTTGYVVSNGKVTMYIEWKDLEGTFYGPVNARGYPPFSLGGKYALQGAGNFEGWKLLGEVWVIDFMAPEPHNGLSGTLLIPN